MEKTIVLNTNYSLREIAGIRVLVPTGEALADCRGIIELNDTAYFLLRQTEKPVRIADLAQSLQERYDLSRKEAMEEAEHFAASLTHADILKRYAAECRKIP